MFRTIFILCSAFLCLVPQATAQDKLPSQQASLQIPDDDASLPGVGPMRRYDWFKKLWAERRGKWAEQVAQDTGAIIFLGDSITQGWGDALGGVGGDAKVANRGISGDTTRGMLWRLQADVLSLKPAAVVMLMGTNDLEEGAEPEMIAANVKQIVTELKGYNSKMPLVLCQVFPSSDTKKRPADKIKKINELCAAAVKGDPQVTVLDTWTLFANAAGDARLEEFPDLLHPNAEGYHKWALALRPILATLGFVEKEADTFEPEAGFVSLFNGRDLTGWYLTSSPKDHLAGKMVSDDGRYLAKNGRLVVTTPAEGRRIQQLWTVEEFPKDFTLKLEFRATPNADSGVFLRKPQLQCRDYPLAGPYKELKNYKPGDWNELVVVAKGGSAFCTCNGEVLEAEFKLPATGPIGLEGDRGQMEYRRIRIQQDQ